MSNIVALDLTCANAKQLIAEIAKDSARVFYTTHAEKRMKERKITRSQVQRCLLHGKITEGPYRDIHGKWCLTLETFSAGEPVAVVAALDKDSDGSMIIIITSY
ncbi:DUF4258 domain-containing protein [Nitrosomonas sp. Nm58]|jgi:hypothetical protein|uniref:DUF4258 domain-containing protein n=1 Tax=Nitrosomonas sp. Nm58 TaxID=200126 RepID=UPI000895ACB9|nr:DUF4258 domain-containing protein [Nitrosomonas sp. Nm58]SDY38641.1 protein of unknown function [Nitrosomonas sp. Nm58]